jgi:hypothetical protein
MRPSEAPTPLPTRTAGDVGISRRIGIGLVTATLAAASGSGWADPPPKPSASAPVDVGLLEFLGSIDAPADSTRPDDRGWLAYLSQINIGKVANASQAPSPAPAQSKRESSATGAGKPGG